MKNRYKILSWSITSVVVIIFLLFLFYRSHIEVQLEKDILLYGAFGIFIAVFILDFFPQYISSYVVSLSAIALGVNPILVGIISIVGSFVASFFAYELGIKASKIFIQEVIDYKDYEKVASAMDKWGKWAVLISVISPLPYIPLLFGALGLGKKNFYLFGVIPRAVVFALISLSFVL